LTFCYNRVSRRPPHESHDHRPRHRCLPPRHRRRLQRLRSDDAAHRGLPAGRGDPAVDLRKPPSATQPAGEGQNLRDQPRGLHDPRNSWIVHGRRRRRSAVSDRVLPERSTRTRLPGIPPERPDDRWLHGGPHGDGHHRDKGARVRHHQERGVGGGEGQLYVPFRYPPSWHGARNGSGGTGNLWPHGQQRFWELPWPGLLRPELGPVDGGGAFELALRTEGQRHRPEDDRDGQVGRRTDLARPRTLRGRGEAGQHLRPESYGGDPARRKIAPDESPSILGPHKVKSGPSTRPAESHKSLLGTELLRPAQESTVRPPRSINTHVDGPGKTAIYSEIYLRVYYT
jgi:hypothetical protein